MSKIQCLYILFVLILIVGFAKNTKTNYEEAGSCICVPQNRCLKIRELLMISPNPPHTAVIKFIEKSGCGIFDNISYVCCHPGHVIIGEPTSVRVTAKPPARSDTGDTTSVRVTAKPPVRSGIVKSNATIQAGLKMLQQQTYCGLTDGVGVGTGTEVNLSEFPWMALLVYSDGTIDCGGSLIHERYVLTAAHCIANKRPVSVRLGEHDTESTEDCVKIGIPRRRECIQPVQEIDVQKAIYHEDYSASGLSDDIGLIRLVSKAVITKSVRPICLPITEKSKNYPVKYMIIAGWGRQGSSTGTTIIQKAAVPVINNEDCQQIYKSMNINITQKQFCAGGENEYDASKGDSGGPVFYVAPYNNGVRLIQYGLISPRHKSCVSNVPEIYVRVQEYLPWIASNLKLN